MRNSLFYGAIIAVLLTVGYFLVPKNESAVAGSVDRAEVEDIVKDFILNNPETLVESLNSFHTKQQQEEQSKAAEKLKGIEGKLVAKGVTPIAGNADGDVTVVEFYDYNCGYCKRAFPTVTQLIEEDKQVKVVFLEMPILSPTSEIAARIALAVNIVDSSKFIGFHAKLMDFKGQKDEPTLLGFAKELGLDEAAVKEKMNSSEVSDELARVKKLAGDLGIRGTPAFIVGEQLIPGAVDVATLKDAVAQARSK